MRDENRFPTFQQARWIILAVMIFTAPLLYYFFVAGGVLPYSAMIVVTIFSIIAMPWTGLWIVNLLHVVVYGFLLLWLSGVLASQIMKHEPHHRGFWLRVIIGGLVVIGFLPVYGVGHGSPEFQMAYTILFQRLW